MVRTRGGSSSRGDASSSRGEPSSSSHDKRRRPKRVDVIHEDGSEEHNEIIQQRYGEDDYVEQKDVEPQEDDYSEEEEEDEDDGFLGGPRDTSLLTHYTQHVAFAMWQGRDRGKIKVISHGKKLRHFGMYHEAIERYISISGLASLVNLSYEYVDHGLIVSLAKRWHPETNTFHLRVGEMSVTLDDVHNLLHLPIMGQFCDVEELEYDEARSHLMDLLGVDRAKASAEMKQSRGPKVRLSWLREVYQECIEQELWECAARAYLLHLLGCTIFTNKSGTFI
ncbi:protein MAIN-LIKE 1-like [Vigna umbellata]|nr:protein MAIN-LIKE 1-like [Vigna umbellata]XP_047177869.1 protein MAIN-LIKE 1-like [Vigna umbellata]